MDKGSHVQYSPLVWVVKVKIRLVRLVQVARLVQVQLQEQVVSMGQPSTRGWGVETHVWAINRVDN